MYDSPCPSSFSQWKKVDNRQEYVSVCLTGSIGNGPIGVAQRATATVWLDDGVRVDYPVVVKLVFPESDCDKPNEKLGSPFKNESEMNLNLPVPRCKGYHKLCLPPL